MEIHTAQMMMQRCIRYETIVATLGYLGIRSQFDADSTGSATWSNEYRDLSRNIDILQLPNHIAIPQGPKL
jgi:hypothetical protein